MVWPVAKRLLPIAVFLFAAGLVNALCAPPQISLVGEGRTFTGSPYASCWYSAIGSGCGDRPPDQPVVHDLEVVETLKLIVVGDFDPARTSVVVTRGDWGARVQITRLATTEFTLEPNSVETYFVFVTAARASGSASYVFGFRVRPR